MYIGLIDSDWNGRFPNIALMKLSAFHKRRGDLVEWYSPFDLRYDICYISKVFSFTPDYPLVINADKIIKGGSGYAIEYKDGKEHFCKSRDIDLIPEVEHIYPDYSLYPQLTENTAYGFLTRGCPRNCPFCIVGKKEGFKSYKVANLNEFWNGQKNIVLCDPNILACKDWKELLRQLIDSGSWVDFNQGLDIRLMTAEKAEMINQIKKKEIRFAWDRYPEKDFILPKLRLYSKYVNPKSHKAIVYTLVNFDTTFAEDLDRIYILRDMGYWPYVMIYDVKRANPKYKRLQRWVNNRVIFGKVKRFEDYE